METSKPLEVLSLEVYSETVYSSFSDCDFLLQVAKMAV